MPVAIEPAVRPNYVLQYFKLISCYTLPETCHMHTSNFEKMSSLGDFTKINFVGFYQNVGATRLFFNNKSLSNLKRFIFPRSSLSKVEHRHR